MMIAPIAEIHPPGCEHCRTDPSGGILSHTPQGMAPGVDRDAHTTLAWPLPGDAADATLDLLCAK